MAIIADSAKTLQASRPPLILSAALAILVLLQPLPPRPAWAQGQGSKGSNATVSPNVPPTAPAPTPSTAAAAAPPPPERGAIITYLSQVIGWYRHLEVEQRLATEPAEILFLADDRQMAAEVVKQAFEYARAQAALLKTENDPIGSASDAKGAPKVDDPPVGAAIAQTPAPGLAGLIKRRDQADAELEGARARLADLQASLAQTPRSGRDALNRQIGAVEGEIDLVQSRVDSLNAMVEFETSSAGAGRASAGLEEQIDELERALPQDAEATAVRPQAAASTAAAAPPLTPAPAPSGIFGRIEGLIKLRQKEQALSDTIDLTAELLAAVAKVRAPLIQALHQIDGEGSALARRANASDLATIKQNKAEFERLSERRKLVGAALLPLSKQVVLLNLYAENVTRWRAAVRQQFSETLRSLILRLFGLALLLAIVFAAAFVWRKLAFRYVQDLQRRHRLLQLRRLTLIVVLFFVLLFDFANELGALATVMGLAAAGVALALQNVILSVAGYFYLSGRFGIRIGDRVQVSGINGDVLEVGLFKLTLMELTEDQGARQPTGRVVVFPNAVVFQPNGNFFKQAPGASFTWKELRLSLAPECDYRLAEKRLLEVVNEVFARYRDIVQRESREMEAMLNVPLETPRPQSRVYLSESGLEIVIRYPAQIMAAAQTADEISRRLVDAIKRDPGLKLVARATPSIQPAAEEDAPDEALAANGASQSSAAPKPAGASPIAHTAAKP
jgi:small-conductance mechanosensitive channel